MNLISSLLSIPDSVEPDSFEWGVAGLSNILHHGTTYEKVEVDFLDGEIRFYRHFDEKKLSQQQVPTLRRSIHASIVYCKCGSKAEPLEESEAEETQPEPKFDNHIRVQ